MLVAGWLRSGMLGPPRCDLVEVVSRQVGHAHAGASLSTSTSPAHDPAVNEHIDGIARQLVERHDASPLELQRVLQEHLRPAQLDSQVQIDILQAPAWPSRRTEASGQVLELKRRQPLRAGSAGRSTDAIACWAWASKMLNVVAEQTARARQPGGATWP